MEPTQRLPPIDAWWNREFPPYSTRRLLFLLAAFPVVGLVPFLGLRAAGVRIPFAMYAIGTVSGAAILALTWRSLRPAQDAAASPLRGFSFPAAGDAGPYEPSLHDFVVALPFAFASIMITLWATSSTRESLQPESVLIGLAVAAVLAGSIVLRYSRWGFVLITGSVGVGAGLLLHLMSLVWQGDASFVVSWLVGSALVATFTYPMWSGMRARHARRVAEGVHRELPTWVLMTAVLILTTGAALTMRFVIS